MHERLPIVCVIGPTASGKTARAIEIARERDGEVISVDSRQVYRTLDIGTEKITPEEMGQIPHHLIDIRDPEQRYNANDFSNDASRLISEIRSRGKMPILAGGTHFYFDALLYGLPDAGHDPDLRAHLEELPTAELNRLLREADAERAEAVDPHNRRRIIRSIEIASQQGRVPERKRLEPRYETEWIVVDHPKEVLRERIDTRLAAAFERGLVEEVRRTLECVGHERLNELGLEYRIVGEFLAGERDEASLLPALSSKLWRFARGQKRWISRLIQETEG
jgi:tRNA dimethylallyltransferase